MTKVADAIARALKETEMRAHAVRVDEALSCLADENRELRERLSVLEARFNDSISCSHGLLSARRRK